MKKNGFTLVELLAVIAILAILVIIALPNVMKMFNNAKESTFTTELKKIYRGAEEEYISDAFSTSGTVIYSKCSSGCTNPLKMDIRDDLEYYIEINSSGKVVEFYAKDGSFQFAHNGELLLTEIEGVQKIADLSEANIIDINKIVDNKIIVKYPEGKNKNNVNIGDIVKISEEEFYVMKRSGNDLYLLSKYNLNVGVHKYSQSTIGIQDSHCVGITTNENNQISQYGVVEFGGNYWNNNVGPNNKYSGSYNDPDYPYVYDENSSLYQYVEFYKEYLETIGVQIKEARIMSYQEATELGCIPESSGNCDNAPSFVTETSYYLGSAYNFGNIWMLFGRYNKLTYGSSNYIYNFGVRPVIVI